MTHPKLFTMELLDVLADYDNSRIDAREMHDQIKSLIAYHEDL
jgi:hypothetical protein